MVPNSANCTDAVLSWQTMNMTLPPLLSRLREKGDDRAYKILKGGLFDLVICPHYLFEIIGFFGISLISQTIYPLCFALGCMFYLTGRSVATKKWYMSKFDDFPAGEVKAIVPYIL